jgi:hypothetical protein
VKLDRKDVEAVLGDRLGPEFRLRASVSKITLERGGARVATAYRSETAAAVAEQFLAAAEKWRADTAKLVEARRADDESRRAWQAKCREAMAALVERFPELKLTEDGVRGSFSPPGRFWLSIEPNSAGSVESFDVYTQATVTKGELGRLLKALRGYEG